MFRPRLVLVLLALAILLPTGASQWRWGGDTEPDTTYDLTWMFQGPPSGERGGVYFNGFLDWDLLDPLVHRLDRQQTVPPTSLRAKALLGVWMDCNGDGYIGYGPMAWMTYPQELLDDSWASPCVGRPPHHVDEVIKEFIEIRPGLAKDSGTIDLEETNTYVDLDARVWADVGRPGDTVPPRAPCLTHPTGAYTLRSTGSVLGYLDCQTGYAIASVISSLDPNDEKDLRYEDPENPQEDTEHALCVDLFWYNPHDCDGRPNALERGDEDAPVRPAFTVWDCDRSQEVFRTPAFTDPVLGLEVSPYHVVVPGLRPDVGGVVNRDGSYEQALDDALDFAHNPSSGECMRPAFMRTGGVVENRLEGPYDPRTVWARRWVDFVLILPDATPRTLPRVPGVGGGVNGLPDVEEMAEKALQNTEGTRRRYTPMDDVRSWMSDRSYTFPKDYEGPLARGSLESAPPLWVTFYAKVGAATSARFTMPTSTANYGAEACGGFQWGVRQGWDCDVEAWWNPALGAWNPPVYHRGNEEVPVAPVPGWVYHLRDVDCSGAKCPGAP